MVGNELSAAARRERAGGWLLRALGQLQELHEAAPATRVRLFRLEASGAVVGSDILLLESLEVLEGRGVMYRAGEGNRYEMWTSAPEAFAGFYLVPRLRPAEVAAAVRLADDALPWAERLGRRWGRKVRALKG